MRARSSVLVDSGRLTMTQYRFAWRTLIAAFLLASSLIACNNQTPAPTPTPAAPPIGATLASTVASSINTPASGLSAEAQDTVIKLTWQAVPNASGYFVYRDGNAQPLNLRPIAETTFTDIGLTNGRTYTYTVAVVDSSNQPGPKSSPITASPKSK